MGTDCDRFYNHLAALELEPLSAARADISVEVLELAEKLLSQPSAEIDAATWHRYLELTGASSFLRHLPAREHCYRWAETTFQTVRLSGYTLESMLAARVRRHPERLLLREAHGTGDSTWTYAAVARRLQILAGLFCRLEAEPRVAILAENSIDSACCDLACLVYRILDTPLNVHFDAADLAWIFQRLGINIVVTDTDEHASRLAEVRSRTRQRFHILVTGADLGKTVRSMEGVALLGEASAQTNLNGLHDLLARRRAKTLAETATVMFTSGSTGAPKGIAYTQYHLITKRFARAAALPSVGDHEVLLCYLPLYHTFGRYLELLGTLYWGGTYVFAGNPSFDSLLVQLREIRPTGLISIPLRWTQIREHCLECMAEATESVEQQAAFRNIVGNRLRWGLSAAGYLDPRVFRFFQRFEVDLCSGFGMTEATGGVTMTPPGKYVDDTVGMPLPGIRTRFGASGELEITGPYVARYLPENGSPDLPPQDPREEHWLATGDLFVVHPNGYLQIVDRIKDIYKNNRGQTIAPRRVEEKLDGVPGIRRAFLVGDGRDSNVLLLVPDLQDPVLQVPESAQREYLDQIVSSANAALSPYERVVNYAVLNRDFSVEARELTPKGSYRRKQIQENFADVIDLLYQSNYVDLQCSGIRVRLPRWLCRNLGLLETDVKVTGGGLCIPKRNRSLALAPGTGSGAVLVGDLEYRITGTVLDLGLFTRQPKLWAGNPSLAAFCPCMDSWDLQTPSVSTHPRLPQGEGRIRPQGPFVHEPDLADRSLLRIHKLSAQALFHPEREALAAVEQLGDELRTADDRLAAVIRTRLEALAWHPSETVRCTAYRILLTDEPMPDYGGVFPAFVESGLSFFNEHSIHTIANADLGDRRLQALRRRLFHYRTQLQWPAQIITREQFVRIFDLLLDFARRNPAFFGPIRSELASWALHRSDATLAAVAADRLGRLKAQFESSLAASSSSENISDRIVLDDGLPEIVVESLRQILCDQTFLRQSIMLASGEEDFDVRQVPPSGIWVSRILSHHQFDLFRAGINLHDGKHYDLLLVVGGDFHAPQVRDTIYWMMALSDHPSQDSAVPRFGAYRPDLKVMSVAYVSDLTVWEKIREFAAAQTVWADAPKPLNWRRLFVRGMAAFFTAWDSSGARIVPGSVTPANVVVPDADFREGACILSLTGWKPYENPLDLILPFVRNFYQRAAAHYPSIAAQLSLSWIFDACLESLGLDQGPEFLARLESTLRGADQIDLRELYAALRAYRAELCEQPHVPLPLLCALDRFQTWEQLNPEATRQAREEETRQLFDLYRINRYPEIMRYLLYRHTYFQSAEAPVIRALDDLLARMFRQPDVRAIHMEELSNVQAELRDSLDREVLSRMIFHKEHAVYGMEVRAVGTGEHKQVILRTKITDKREASLSVREPILPAEIGHLYRLFRESDYPTRISESEHHLVIVDGMDQVLGGLKYVEQEPNVVYLRGIVVAAALRGRGIAGALLEDFLARMAVQGVHLVKTDFFLRQFFAAHGFRVDPRWGGLVRHLAQD
jgi:long-chain acyl-CoA synthetase